MKQYKKLISEIISDAVASEFSCGIDACEILQLLEYPPDDTLGDIAMPCFKLSRTLRRSPVQIAEAIVKRLDTPLASASAVNGYINIKIADSYLSGTVLHEIEEKGRSYGSSDEGAGRTVLFDYASPNVAKPFHIGHLGTTVIGHSLKLLHEFSGYNCVGINHLGDWGTQFGKMIVAYRLWGNREEIEKGGIDELVRLYVKFHDEAERDETLIQKAREEFHKLEGGDEEDIKLWKWIIEISLREYEITFAQLGIKFDSYLGESFYVDKTPEQIELLREKGLLKLDGGASIVELEEYNMPPCLILKADGSTIYPTRDIAAAVYRKRTYDFYKCVYVTSAGQSLHFAQFFKVLELMGYDWCGGLVHVPYGTVSIDGSKLATRTGNVVLLRDLFATAIEKVRAIIDEKNPDLADKDATAEAVGVGAVVFHYLYNNRIKDINFVMEQALSFDGATGPYAQYTYARTCSILEKASPETGGEAVLSAPEEAALLKTLARFPERVAQALSDYEPSVITRYIIEVCTAFNRFYNSCPVLSAKDANIRATRLRLVAAAKTVLGNALPLICMKTPEKI